MTILEAEFRQDRETDWWTVTVPNESAVVTQGKTLREAYERVRAALGLVRGDVASITLVGKAIWDDRQDLPPAVLEAVKRESALRLQQLEIEAAIQQSTPVAVAVLIERHEYSYRAAGQLLGITHQRVEQIHKASKESARQVRWEVSGN